MRGAIILMNVVAHYNPSTMHDVRNKFLSRTKWNVDAAIILSLSVVEHARRR